MSMVDQQLAKIGSIVEYLREHGPASYDEISAATELSRPEVRNLVRLSQQAGQVGRAGVDRGDVRYQATQPTEVADTAPTQPVETATDDGEHAEVVDDSEARDAAALSLIRASSGLTTRQVAQQLGLDDDQRDLAYASIRRLRSDGFVDRADSDGREAIWTATGEADAEAS